MLNVTIFLHICHFLSSVIRQVKGNEGCRWAKWKDRDLAFSSTRYISDK